MDSKDTKIEEYKISDIRQTTHDTRQFRFDLDPDRHFTFLPGDHMKIYPYPDKPLEFRPYTPTTPPDGKDHFELIIKHYPDGNVSKYMGNRNIDDKVAMSGPHPGGHFVDGMAKKVGMVAGGTGITPMISMIRSILSRGLDVEISLLFANKTVDDILLKDEFDRYANEHRNFTRYYVVSKAPSDWDMGTGRIDIDLMNARLPSPADDTVIFVCGPPRMQIDIREKLIEIGHAKEKVIFP